MHVIFTFKKQYGTRYYSCTDHFHRSIYTEDVCSNEGLAPPSVIIARRQHCPSNDIRHLPPLYSEDIRPVSGTSKEPCDKISWINSRPPKDKINKRILCKDRGENVSPLSRVAMFLPSSIPHAGSFSRRGETANSIGPRVRKFPSQPLAKGGNK